MTDENLEITWLGHATVHVQTPDGKDLLIDPWLQENPSCPEEWKDLENVDGMVLSHGHFDHVGDAPRLVEQFQPEVIGIFEVITWLENSGAEHAVPMNEGGTYESEKLNASFTAVHARHSSGILTEENSLVPGGNPLGWILEFSDGSTVYFSGDTNVFGDMKLIDELYEPEVALLPIGDHFTMGPREAAKAIQILNADRIIPVHYGTFDVLTGTPEKLRNHLTPEEAETVISVDPGETVTL